MKNKVIYSRISQENSKKFSFKDSESPKLSQSQVVVLLGTRKEFLLGKWLAEAEKWAKIMKVMLLNHQ